MNDDNINTPTGLLDEFSPLLPARQRILGLFMAKWTVGAVRPLVELGVPDLLADGPRTATELAGATDSDPETLYRVLRCSATAGIFAEAADGTFALTPVSESLRVGAPGGVREMFLFASDPMLWRPYEDVLRSVRTGEPAFDHAFGMSFFEYLRAHPASSELFDAAMTQNRYPASDQILAEFDFARFTRIADIGGGMGQFLVDILGRNPGCTGVLCDLPHVVADAPDFLAGAGVADRVEVVDTDFFTAVPGGCDAYVIKHVLHNWNDRDAARIVRTVRTAMGEDRSARLLIVDMVLTGPGVWDVGKFADIEMLVALGGRERSIEEWHRLLAAEGFEPANDPKPGDLAILEYRARR